jgi:hypothetical protein
MFILNNFKSRQHTKAFPTPRGKYPALFDLDRGQLQEGKNSAWFSIQSGSIVAVLDRLKSRRPIRQICRVIEITDEIATITNPNELPECSVLHGEWIATALDERNYNVIFRHHNVINIPLQRESFGLQRGTNVLNLGAALDALQVQIVPGTHLRGVTAGDILTVGQLKRCVAAEG